MSNALVCKVCAGTEFNVEDGFYYCSECQTQTQELREQIYEFQETIQTTRTVKRKIRKEKSVSGIQQKLTSWETYNYILAGLVKELIELGANDTLKDVSYNLWLKYLIQLEIMTRKSEDEPKLGAVYRKWDAEIIFQKHYEKKKKKRSNSARSVGISSTGETDLRALSREIAKEKRTLMNIEYEQFSSAQPSSNQSIHNKTLSSISYDSDLKEKPGVLKFSKAAVKELCKSMGKTHMLEHAMDVENKLKCHRITTTLVSANYAMGPLKLTRNKLYAVLYISMLLTREKFQLSDIVRFCREGQLSFWDYKHLFPDTDAKIDDQLYQTGSNALFTYNFIRKSACDLYKLLKFRLTDLTPNLVDLCQRYCNDLNLPDQVFRMASQLINETKPKLLIKKSTVRIPNYEGRVMAFILYSLKVLLSIDDVTERHLSKFATSINKTTTGPKMFVWDDWYNYIEYRKVLLNNLHFPTKYNAAPDCKNMSDLFTTFRENKAALDEPNEKIPHSVKIAKKLLNDLLLFQEPTNTQKQIEFKHSLTPSRTYIETILNSGVHEIAGYTLKTDMLKDFSSDSIEYLIDHTPYLDSEKCKVKYKTAHTNEKIRKMRYTAADRRTKNYREIFDEKWQNAFKTQKSECVRWDTIADKVLDKHMSNVSKPESVVQIDKKSKLTLNDLLGTSKKELHRDSKGRFCTLDTGDRKDASEFKPPRIRGKWFLSPARKNPLLEEHKYNPSLWDQVNKDTKNKKSTKKKGKRIVEKSNDSDEYNLHYVPRFEYWVNVKNCRRMSSRDWVVFEKNLPHNFQWLLAECARTVEQLPKDLFNEFVNVELYVNYVHLKHVPIIKKNYDNYSELTQLIASTEKYW